MANIYSIATKKVDDNGNIEKLNFRTEESIRTSFSYVTKGSIKEHPLYSGSKGFLDSENNPEEMSEESIAMQKLYRKIDGHRVRQETVEVSKYELGLNKVKEIKRIAVGFSKYYYDMGFQIAFGVYEKPDKYEIKYTINPVNFEDGSKYRHNNHSIQEQEESFLATVVSDVTGQPLPDNGRADFEELEYS